HAWTHAFRGRKEKKRVFRALWNTQINAAVRAEGLTYGKFVNALKKKGVKIDRKILSNLAQNEPETFKKIVEFVK
ncbi:50S ribosomal protein L20, partial [Candidatus Jorgensenbacteria bacterium GWA1_49_17]